MARGVQVGIYLRPGLENEDFVAEALGNLAAFRLEQLRKEPLQWQVLRVEGSPGQHHYRVIIRHPQRALDIGIRHDLSATLNELSSETEKGLAEMLATAETQGLRPVAIRSVSETVDYWRDDFWNWFE
jgi:hypothetical protein